MSKPLRIIMPKRKMTDYYRSTKRRRTSYKRRPTFNRKRSRRGKNAVPRILRGLVEKKLWAATGTDADVGDNGHFMYLNNGLPQGDGLQARDGRKVTFTKLQFRALLQPDGSNVAYRDQYIRFFVVLDKTPNLEALTLADIVGTTDPILEFRTWNESFRYKVLGEKLIKLNARRLLIPSTDIQSTSYGSQIVDFSIPLNMTTEWLSSTGGTDQCTRNSVCVIAVANDVVSNISMQWYSRMQFVDL